MGYKDKYIDLMKYLKELDKVVVAFSGGVDSTFLLKAAKDALGDKVMAVTIQSPYIPRWEIEEARELSLSLGIIHKIVKVGIIDEIKKNPEDRCYLCKKAVFGKILSVAHEEGYNYVVDGTNFDDIKDYRPGLKALEELDVRSPIKHAKLTKEEVRTLSNELGLPTWDKPAYACLLTRIPYGMALREEDFIKIEKAEKSLIDLGFRAVRVRCHEDIARIELPMTDVKKLIEGNVINIISEKVKEAGFKYVTLDLDGYRMGSFNVGIAGAMTVKTENSDI